MITVTVTRSYPEATHYSTNESGVLRVWNGLDCVAQYERGIAHTVSYEPAVPPADPIEEIVEEIVEEIIEDVAAAAVP